jgi:hypothetical protein
MAAVVLFWPRAARKVVESQTHLDAAHFRSNMQDVETVLYSTGPLDSEQRYLLRTGLLNFQLQVRGLRPSLAQRRALEHYDMFCVVTSHEAEQDDFDRVAARRRWEELRAANFLPAPWFRTSSATVEQGQASEAGRGIPPDHHLYQPIIDELRLAISRVEMAARTASAEEDAGVDDVGFDRRQTMRSELKADLDRIRQAYPVTFDGMEPHWRKAHRDLGEAMKLVEYMRISRARAAVEEAQQSLNAAMAVR